MPLKRKSVNLGGTTSKRRANMDATPIDEACIVAKVQDSPQALPSGCQTLPINYNLLAVIINKF